MRWFSRASAPPKVRTQGQRWSENDEQASGLEKLILGTKHPAVEGGSSDRCYDTISYVDDTHDKCKYAEPPYSPYQTKLSMLRVYPNVRQVI
jgi:hypothetical protein